MKISNLPRDLTEEVLSRIPLTSLRRVRSTCKTWNTVSKDQSFAKKNLGGQANIVAAKKRVFMVMMMDYRVYLMSVNLHNNVESCIKREGKLISLDDDEVLVSRVFHCDGLLLCIMKDNTRLVVWNPYWGQTWWTKPTHSFGKCKYALGYKKTSSRASKSCRSHKILKFIDYFNTFSEFNIYEFNSDSWRVLDVTLDWRIDFCHSGVSLKGNTYWYAEEKDRERDDRFLVCFDFTRERFGPRLPLPFEWNFGDTMSLSSVREEQLVVLIQHWDRIRIEIWVTTKIEPNTVSWNSKVFLEVNIKQLISPHFQFSDASFFIDEEKKLAVVFDTKWRPTRRNIAYIIGVDGSLKADLGEYTDIHCVPFMCSYVPSLVQLN